MSIYFTLIGSIYIDKYFSNINKVLGVCVKLLIYAKKLIKTTFFKVSRYVFFIRAQYTPNFGVKPYKKRPAKC